MTDDHLEHLAAGSCGHSPMNLVPPKAQAYRITSPPSSGDLQSSRPSYSNQWSITSQPKDLTVTWTHSHEAKQGDTRCEQGEEAKTCKCSSVRDGTRDQKLPAYGLSSLRVCELHYVYLVVIKTWIYSLAHAAGLSRQTEGRPQSAITPLTNATKLQKSRFQPS